MLPHVPLNTCLLTEFKRVLANSGLSQAEFARRVGVSQKHLSLYLNGHAGVSLATLDYWTFTLGYEWHVELHAGT